MEPKKAKKPVWRENETAYHLHLSRNPNHDTGSRSMQMLEKNREKAIPHLLNILVEDRELKSQSALALGIICSPEHIQQLKKHAEEHPENTEIISEIIKKAKKNR